MPIPPRARLPLLLLLSACSGCGGDPHAQKPMTAEAKALLAAKAEPNTWEDLDAAHPGTRLRDPRTGIVFRRVPKGTFAMGNVGGSPLEGPPHQVTLTKDWLLAETEVTVAQWQRWLDEHGGAAATPASKYTPTHPATHMLWDEAVAFCTTYGYRLPTEAEWERACRAEQKDTEAPWRSERALTEHAWFHVNSAASPHAVGTLPANAYGLHDMLGNVWEYCADWVGPYSRGAEAETDPTGAPAPVKIPPLLHGDRALRGGSWFSLPGPTPSMRAEVEEDPTMRRNGFTGFRPARSL